jgi:hypothetical protein
LVGDHTPPVCHYGLPIFSPHADSLIREISQYLSRHRLYDLFRWFNPPPIAVFERQDLAKRDELRRGVAGSRSDTVI